MAWASLVVASLAVLVSAGALFVAWRRSRPEVRALEFQTQAQITAQQVESTRDAGFGHYSFRLTNVGGAPARRVNAWLVAGRDATKPEPRLTQVAVAGSLAPQETKSVTVLVPQRVWEQHRDVTLVIQWFDPGASDRRYHFSAEPIRL